MIMVSGEALTDKIVTALAQLRAARNQGEFERELTWTYILDRLLDRYSAGHR
ncbi:hypothetical protein PP713_14185 [Mycobacterium sp. CSUR Q5927]|nr:hypothetical protein [Mycobacterium sp. CSUR Q5927]